MDISFYFDNLKQYMGSGLVFQLLLVGILYLGLSMKKSLDKTMLVWFPIYALCVYFCPVWILYMKLRSDGEILYRVLWMIPVAAVVCYSLVEYIYLFPKKKRIPAIIMALILIALSGRYMYSNPQYNKAENAYHVPQVVVDICDDIVVPGREIGACFPMELTQYVRQYSAYVCQPYGRDSLVWGMVVDFHSNISEILSKDVIDTVALISELRINNIPYLILEDGRKMSASLSEYGYDLIKAYGNYDLYLDSKAYIGDFKDLTE